MTGRLFKLKSSKDLFIVGAVVSVVIAGVAAFRDRTIIESNYKLEDERHWLEQVFEFVAIAFVLLVNLFYCSKLIEGIVFHLPYKILPWICINGVNIIQLVIYFFSVDSSVGYLSLLTFCYIWLTVLLLFFEIKKNTSDESLEFSQPTSSPVEALSVPYGNLSDDRSAF